MKASRFLAFGLSFAFVFTFMVRESRSDVIGDTYDLGATVFTAGFAAGAFIDDGPPSLTFDGTTKVLGNLVFGNAGDLAIVQETQVVTGDQFVVTVLVLGQDAAGNLTNWVADGTTIDDDGDPLTPAVPFEIPILEIGVGNGGTDSIDVDQSGGTYTFVDSEALILTTAGGLFTFGSGSGNTDIGGPTGNFTGGVAFDLGPDLAEPSAALGGGEFAGFGFSYTYTITAVPEPATAGFLILGLAGLVVQRRRC